MKRQEKLLKKLWTSMDKETKKECELYINIINRRIKKVHSLNSEFQL